MYCPHDSSSVVPAQQSAGTIYRRPRSNRPIAARAPLLPATCQPPRNDPVEAGLCTATTGAENTRPRSNETPAGQDNRRIAPRSGAPTPPTPPTPPASFHSSIHCCKARCKGSPRATSRNGGSSTPTALRPLPRTVASLALLADEAPRWRPRRFQTDGVQLTATQCARTVLRLSYVQTCLRDDHQTHSERR